MLTGESSPQNRLNDSLSTPSPSQQRSSQESKFLKDDIVSPYTPKPVEPLSCKLSYFLLPVSCA